VLDELFPSSGPEDVFSTAPDTNSLNNVSPPTLCYLSQSFGKFLVWFPVMLEVLCDFGLSHVQYGLMDLNLEFRV
jgi:hypothetical protein